LSAEESWVFDSMNGTFEARLRRMTVQTRTSKGDGREISLTESSTDDTTRPTTGLRLRRRGAWQR